MSGRVEETYAAALQHDIYQANATLVGVVRRPTGWFRALVDENHPELGPPEPLLKETKERHEQLKARGMCDEGAHNAAWEGAKFAERYQAYLDAESPAALDTLVARATAGENLTLVCFEGEGKRCHRHLLLERLREQL